VLLYNLEILQEAGPSERRLSPGAVVIGGGLQADLVIPALLDAELCELILPSVEGKPPKVTALVEGLIVNGRELKRGQSVTSPRLELSADGVMLRIGDGADESQMLAGPARSAQDTLQETLTGWIGRAKGARDGKDGARDGARDGASSAHEGHDRSAKAGPDGAVSAVLRAAPAMARLRANPGLALMGLALGLALVAFIMSGWPSARFTPPGLSGIAGGERDSPAALLAEIRRRLVAADLAGAVRAEIAGGGVRLSGAVDPIQAPRLGELVRGAASRPGGATLRNDVTMASADAATGIEAIVTAPTTGVVVSGGRLFREGQATPTGWLIESISPTEVRLRRDTVSHVIAMSGPTPDMPPVAARAADGGVKAPAQGRVRGLEFISSAPPEPPAAGRQRSGAVLVQQDEPERSAAQPRPGVARGQAR
jgi:hypothetical protein